MGINHNQVSSGRVVIMALVFIGFMGAMGVTMGVLSPWFVAKKIAALDADGYKIKARLDPLTKYLRKRPGKAQSWEYYACLRPADPLSPEQSRVWGEASAASDFPNRVSILKELDERIIEHLTRIEFESFHNGQVVDFQFKADEWRIVRPNEYQWALIYGAGAVMLFCWGLAIYISVRNRRNRSASLARQQRRLASKS